ncbi:MAG: hypothetical protein J6L62_07620 [Clostridia bacterium]|nr:hypothetical protein [Clostridia bacterium]
MSSSSKALVERVYSFLEKADLFVWDFSILMTMENIQLINWLANMAIKNHKQILVSEEFYRCYSIVVKSSSAEQREIANNTKSLLTLLKKHSALALNSKYRTTESLVKALQSNPKVAFLVSANSEAAELLVSSDKTKAMILAITQEGKLCCCDREKLSSLINTEINNDDKNKFILPVDEVPATGMKVKTADGKLYSLLSEISSGAEGTVYTTDDNDYVCKIFHKKQLSVLRCKKLKFFENRQVRYDGICWPENIIYTQDGKPVGYVMQRAYGRDMSKIFDGEETIHECFPDWNRADLVDLAVKLLEKFIYLHLLGIKIGDIRPQNIVIGDDGSVYLIDMDSCQIEDYPCPFGDEDYTPAENQGKTFDSFLRTYKNERFSIFVLIFTVLFLGAHPYAQKNGADTIAEEIYTHAFPYPANKMEKCEKAPVGGYDIIWRITPQNICDLFYECFKNDNRPDIVELLMQLDAYSKSLKSRKSADDIELKLGFESVDVTLVSDDAKRRNLDVRSITDPYKPPVIDDIGQVSVPSSAPPLKTADSQSSAQDVANKKNKSTVTLWLIILVCLYLLVTIIMVFAFLHDRGNIPAYIRPIMDFVNYINLGG